MSAAWRADGAARRAIGEPPEGLALSQPALEALGKSELSEDLAHLAWELVTLAGSEDPTDLVLAILLQDALSRGSTRLSLEDTGLLEARARALLAADDALAAAVRARAEALREGGEAGPLFGGPGDGRPLVIERGHLYAHRVRAAEVRLVERIGARVAERLEPTGVDAALDAVEARPSAGITLTGEQREAVRQALGEPLTVIRGGPGTGKTSVVVAILRAAARIGIAPEAIALAAPTGKAADRARAAIERGLAAIDEPSGEDRALTDGLPSPRTLHRLLGYSPSRGGFRQHADNPLAERLVVVDESSMIDLALMDSLLGALRPGARLVLLGDAEQLPSVAAGAVFRDLGDAGVPGVRLTESHRMDPTRPEGFNILSVAAAMNEGRREPLCDVLDEAAWRPADPTRIARLPTLPDGELGGTFHFAGPIESLLSWWRIRHVRDRPPPVELEDVETLRAHFAELERARLLCVTRSAGRPTGVESVNAWLHGQGPWRAGEPILVHRNDYARSLFNGDQGLLLDVRTDEGPRLRAVFRRGERFVTHPLESVRAVVELGYATTVHKAQGSEHDVVVLLLPDTDSPRLLTREVVYTAITRARRAVIVAGDLALLDRAAGRAIVRSSGVAERLLAGGEDAAVP